MSSVPQSPQAAASRGETQILAQKFLIVWLKVNLCLLSHWMNAVNQSFPHRNLFGPVLGSSPAQNPPVLPSMQPGFGGNLYNTSFDIFRSAWRFKATPAFYLAVPSTNPFVAATVAPEMATNPFQTNGRAPTAGGCQFLLHIDLFFLFWGSPVTLPSSFWFAKVSRIYSSLCVCLCVCTHCLCLVASFGTGSMSMPAGFGNASSYCLPTSFSGNFQQQFPGQAPIPYSQPGAYHPQSNG